MTGKTDFLTYIAGIREYWKKRAAVGRAWGWKEISSGGLIGFALWYFERPTIIRCRRRCDLVANSIKKKLPAFGNIDVGKYVEDTERYLDNILYGRPYIMMEFDGKRRSDFDIIREIKEQEVIIHGMGK